jgi:3-dehydroquinate synthase
LSAIKSDGYSVHIGDDSLSQLDELLKVRTKYSQYFIIVDENTLEHCLPVLLAQIPLLKDAEVIETESGEENKTIEIVTQVWMAMSDFHADRKTLVINLGGGVISDMGGFIASTYKRGVDFLNIATTLLSQVDASVGGKLGIDLGGLKNQVGVFNFPQGVFIYPDFLNTLPKEQLRSGFAEVLKHALIKDAGYWEIVKKVSLEDFEEWPSIIHHSVGIKNKVVMNDPTEQGERKLLNYGHTIGHAIETFHLENEKLTTLLHGEAIAIGMIAEGYLSFKYAGLSQNKLNELVIVMCKFFPPAVLEESDFQAYLDLMVHDKKNEKGKINFSLLESIGSSKCDVFCKQNEILKALKFYNETAKKYE